MSRKGMFTRYKFIKKLYPNYLVIIKYNDKFKSFRMDDLLLNYLIDNNKIKKLNKLKINCVIVNNVNVNLGVNVGGSGSNRNLGVRSALFLKSDVEILSGDGTNDNPFVLE